MTSHWKSPLPHWPALQDAEDRLDPANDLLSSFNVATFKNTEDDAAFWNRLISKEQLNPQQPPVSARRAVSFSR